MMALGLSLPILRQGQIRSPKRLNGKSLTMAFNGGKLAAKDYILPNNTDN